MSDRENLKHALVQVIRPTAAQYLIAATAASVRSTATDPVLKELAGYMMTMAKDFVRFWTGENADVIDRRVAKVYDRTCARLHVHLKEVIGLDPLSGVKKHHLEAFTGKFFDLAVSAIDEMNDHPASVPCVERMLKVVEGRHCESQEAGGEPLASVSKIHTRSAP